MFLTFSAADRLTEVPYDANIFLKQNLAPTFVLQHILAEKGLSLGLDEVRQDVVTSFVAVPRCI